MKRSRFSNEQIIGILKEHEARIPTAPRQIPSSTQDKRPQPVMHVVLKTGRFAFDRFGGQLRHKGDRSSRASCEVVDQRGIVGMGNAHEFDMVNHADA